MKTSRYSLLQNKIHHHISGKEGVEICTSRIEHSYWQLTNRGRNWKVEIGQVGVRCKHCYKSNLGNKPAKSSRYFPLDLAGVYQAAQNIYHSHFKHGHCANMPRDTEIKFDKVEFSRSKYGGGREYWISSIESLGVVESHSCLRMKDNKIASRSSQDECKSEQFQQANVDFLLHNASNNKYCIVHLNDRHLVTDYVFLLMCQMTHYQSNTNNDNENSSWGLVCKHCNGKGNKGIFKRTKIASISKNEYFHQLHSHLESCSLCPIRLKEMLRHLKKSHDGQKRKLKRGNRMKFLNRILNRLNNEL